MGVFDDVRCLYPLPWTEAHGGLFQSKCTPAQYCERYEIRANGELWFHSVKREWREDSSGFFGGRFHAISDEWVRENYTGEIEIYARHAVDNVTYWYSVQFWFRDGLVKDAVFNKSECDNQASEAEPWPQLQPEDQP